MEEFALCWNNFQDNIASGFQNLYDRGDLVDVTLACDGKLLRAHKIVLAICSPYFQEMFVTNPCKHPIIILKDVTYSVMTELLQFMYQGEVNVKHTELPTFMKIAETLQIKGLTTGNKCSAQNSPNGTNLSHKFNSSLNPPPQMESPMPMTVQKRGADLHEGYSIFPKRQMRQHRTASDVASHEGSELTTSDSVDHNHNATSMSEDVFMPSISMGEPNRFDLSNVKRENVESIHSPTMIRTSITSPFNFEYGPGPNNGGGGPPTYKYEYPNDLHMTSEHFSKTGNHMDIPAGASITMLSSTSLLHGNCVFNRNNTVATQQGMKTYWLCKSYRVSMCRARCITHQGRIISATGVHNHPPHIKSGGGCVAGVEGPPVMVQSGPSGVQQVKVLTNSNAPSNPSGQGGGSQNNVPVLSVVTTVGDQPSHQHQPIQQQPHLPPSSSQNTTPNSSNSQQIHHHPHPPSHPPSHSHQQHHAQHQQPSQQQQQQQLPPPQPVQNMMQNVLSQNNLMQLTNMSPMINPPVSVSNQSVPVTLSHTIVSHGPQPPHHNHHPHHNLQHQQNQHQMNSHQATIHILHSPSGTQPPSTVHHQPHSHHQHGHHQTRPNPPTAVLQQQQNSQQSSPRMGENQVIGLPTAPVIVASTVANEHAPPQPTNLIAATQMRISP